MLEQKSQPITFYGFFTASKIGKTGLTVTIDVYSASNALLVTGGSASAIGGGLYSYTLAGASTGTAGDYKAIFKTADATVDQQHMPSLWIVGQPWIERQDATISSRSSHSAAQAAAAVWDYLTSAAATVGSLGKRIGDMLDATISSRLADADYTPAPTASAIDTELSGSHGAGAWTASGAAPTVAEINAELTTAHGSGSWAATIPTAISPAGVIAGAVTIRRGDVATTTLTGLGSLVGRSKLWLTIKRTSGDGDSASVLQVEETAGLLVLNRAVASADGAALTVTDAAAGTVIFTPSAATSAALMPMVYTYDVQALFATGPRTIAEGNWQVVADITRAID